MSNAFSFIKKSVFEKNIYVLPNFEYEIKLNQNENPYDLPGVIKSKILAEVEKKDWNRYPELSSHHLREKIAGMLNLSHRSVMVGNGSNEIMFAIMTTLLEHKKKMITVAPTFSLYVHYGRILGAEVLTLPLGNRFQFPVENLIREASPGDVALTVLCSPNNPTANCLSQNDLEEILDSASGFVLVDEAYFDFSEQDFSGMIGEFENLIITRTFSKACAFSFGRFGYGLANEKLVSEVYKVILPYNLSGFAECAAIVLLDNQTLLRPIISEIKKQREIMYSELSKMNHLTVFPSQANFLLIRPEIESGRLFDVLIREKILVRDVAHYPGLGNHLRISVGKPAENEKLLSVLRSVLG